MHTRTYIEVSNNIQVEVRPLYLESESDPIARKHVFVYFITIRNQGSDEVQLFKRHWEIKDSIGEKYEVDGDGVIGKKPVIAPGQAFEYNSSCVLKSFQGVMKGYYLMEHQRLGMIKVKIPRFILRSHLLN